MKKFLHKRWHSIPIGIITAILVVCLLAGSVLAAYMVFTNTIEIAVKEPLEVTEVQIPGWFWDWRTPEVPAVQQEVYAGMDLGLAGWGGKYLIHNISPQPVQVTITVSESTGQTDWYGLRGFYSTTTHTAQDTCNWGEPICYTNPGEVRTFTFELGATPYVYYAGMQGSEVLSDSNSVMFFIEAKIASEADPLELLNFTVTVTRGQ